ncbi:MAG: ribonuclease Y [Oscillospiraceae bacterium]|nr:ribonuclease Y [Oscillospiraceae bacterium]
MTWLYYVVSAVIAVAVGAACFYGGVAHRRRVAEARIGSAEDEAKRIVNDAIKSAEQKRKEALIEAKDEIFRMRGESDRELRERRSELQRQEHRLFQKEENLDKKTASMDAEEQKQQRRAADLDKKIAEAEDIKKSQFEALERISNFTADQAKDMLMQQLDEELSHEKAMRINAYDQQLKDESDAMARDILSLAISRCATDFASEATVSVVALPNDDMKGRIIGREGRNIRALETVTGVDLIIDDTPEAITISSFDPIRREVARLALEKLIFDGRIHPARIEETVEKARREVDQKIKKEGERVVLETGVHGIHPELVKLLGRLHFRTSYGQNVLDHSVEVALLSGMLASELGLDPTIAKRAGLLHDIGKALDHEMEGTHVQLGVDVARRYKESATICNAIEAHHGDVEATSSYVYVVMAADAISAARPGARSENLENYIKRLEKLEEIANSYEGVERSFAIQAGREIRIMVKPEVIDDDRLTIVAHDIVTRIESELNYPGQIKVNVIRESRATDIAK